MTSITLFFAKWCPACKNFRPRWNELSKWCDGEKIDAIFNEVEEAEQPSVSNGRKNGEKIFDATRFNVNTITAFPTILIQKPGEQHIVVGGDDDKIKQILSGTMVQTGGSFHKTCSKGGKTKRSKKLSKKHRGGKRKSSKKRVSKKHSHRKSKRSTK